MKLMQCMSMMVVILLVLLSCVLGQEGNVTSSEDLNFFSNHVRAVNASQMGPLELEAIANASSHITNTSLTDLQNDQGTMDLRQRYRARKKQERLMLIQANILERLRVTPSRQPNITTPVLSQEERHRMGQLFERMRTMRQQQLHGNELDRPNRVYAERIQSLYPACIPPNNTDRGLWENAEQFRLLYSLNLAPASELSETTVLVSRLRIYKFASPDPQQLNCVDCTHSSYPQFLVPTQTLTVSIYYFSKPLRVNRRVKKRFVESRVISADMEGWIEFNIASALQFWIDNRNKNFGLDIEVEDNAGNKHNPGLYFRGMNCSEGAEMASNESSLFDNQTYPTLDLQTAEITRQEVLNDNSQDNTPTEAGRLIRKRHAGVVFLRNAWYQTCRMKHIYVSFRDLGLEEAAEDPESGVIVGYCTGRCYKDDHGATNHMEERSCVAKSFRPLRFKLYNQDGELQDYTLNDVSAKDCSCKT